MRSTAMSIALGFLIWALILICTPLFGISAKELLFCLVILMAGGLAGFKD